MKTFLLFLCGPFVALAQPGFPPAFWEPSSAVNPCAGFTNITCDIWQSFEYDGEVTAANLAANDGTNTTATWAISGGKVYATNSFHQNMVKGMPQNTCDTGTHGMIITNNDSTLTAYIQCNVSPATNNISVGFWFYAPSFSVTASAPVILGLLDSGSGRGLQVVWRKNTTYDFRMATSTQNIEGGSVSPDTWYYVSARYQASGTCSVQIYDTTGAPVGTTSTATDASGLAISKVRLGITSAGTAAAANDFKFDNLLIDWSAAKFPLGP